ncbi:hypothetical protein LL912_21895 [Niabella sp. CC-SYL272]|uniref:hypothetical protein n=1 Tax=Niabella agricola TaxID=2891571 RepID=UPI001F1DA031|nr:hypothetical protein [Niabella agricola]MCF3111454.1 hypothetical protein [Niabella agricola]
MKKIFLLFVTLAVFLSTAAQIIQVSGGCVDIPVALAQVGTVNGKPAYSGTGTVAGQIGTVINVYWLGPPDNVWVVDYDGQPYFSCSKDTPLPPGTSAFPWTAVTPAPCPSPAPLQVTGDVALWVAFGAISADIKKNVLSVHWESLTEVDNDHFEIEASRDGVMFIPIATVVSKAENGNSSATIGYDWNSGGMVSLAALGGMALVVLLWMCSRRSRVALAGLCIILLCTPGCTKTKDIDAKDKPNYIRIAHVGKDGVKLYSRIVKIVEE